MAYIDPDGIFNGDRMSLLSDEAKLYWPYFWCASNTAGRIELNYRKVMKRAFGHFTLPPTEEMFWRWAREYREAFLLFTYKHNGQIWGQWDVTARYLPKHTLAADSKTPAPDGAAMSAWKDQYITQKSARQGKTLERDTPSEAEQQLHDFANPIPANNFAHLEKVLTERRDLGSGNGNGNGEEETKPLPLSAAQVTPDPPPGKEFQLIPPEVKKKKPAINLPLIVEPYAITIHGRHIARKCTLRETKELLVDIVRLHPKSAPLELLDRIDCNHEKYCRSYDWTKEGGSFCPGLDKWLNPNKERYLIEAEVQQPTRAGPISREDMQRKQLLDKAKQMGI